MVFVSENLKEILHYLGWGDPDPILLFLGVEESKPFGSLEDIDSVKGKTVIPVGEKSEICERYAIPIAKIAAPLSEGGKRDRYCSEKLFRANSGVANINLYPLGKESLRTAVGSRNPSELFGEIVNFEEIYRAFVKAERFPIIRRFIKQSKNLKGIVCYGKTHWEDFIFLLELYGEGKYRLPPKVGEDFLVFEPKGNGPVVILMPHVSARKLSDRQLEEISNTLRDFGIRLP